MYGSAGASLLRKSNNSWSLSFVLRLDAGLAEFESVGVFVNLEHVLH